MVNYNDIAGPYAGLVFGMVNTFGTMPGFIAPGLVGLLTPNVSKESIVLFFERLIKLN